MYHDHDADECAQVEALLSGPPPRAHAPPESVHMCRICLSEDTAPGDRLLAPCRCKGTARYVHASCLDRWRSVSMRRDSVIACDQCRTPYKLRASATARLLASPLQHTATALLLLFIVIVLGGVAGSILLERHQPELFDGTHPYLVQSLSLSAALATTRPNKHVASFPTDLFQPSVLVQSVQGMVQRLIQWALGIGVDGDAHSFSTTFWAFSVQRFAQAAGQQPAVRMPTAEIGAVERLVWLGASQLTVSLGIAVVGILSSFNVFLAITILSPSTNTVPFSLVGRTVHASPSCRPGDVCARLVWQSLSLPGVLVLCFSLVGIYRTYAMLHRGSREASLLTMAGMGMSVCDYDEPVAHRSRWRV